MERDPIVFAMANPVPEIQPEEAGPFVRVMATGRSDYPNQINNSCCFPGLLPRHARRPRAPGERRDEARRRSRPRRASSARPSSARSTSRRRCSTGGWWRRSRTRWPRRPSRRAWPGANGAASATAGRSGAGAGPGRAMKVKELLAACFLFFGALLVWPLLGIPNRPAPRRGGAGARAVPVRGVGGHRASSCCGRPGERPPRTGREQVGGRLSA